MLERLWAQRRTKSTRKRSTPESAGSRPFPESAFSGVLRFRVLFVPLSSQRAPKSTRKRNTPENADYGNGRLPAALSGVLRFRVLFGACQIGTGQMSEKRLILLKFLRHVMRAFLSEEPKCSHGRVSRREIPFNLVQVLKHATRI